MAQISKSIVIDRPIEEVFDVATCLQRCVVWQSQIVATHKVSTGPVGVGTEYEHNASFFGVMVKTHPVITRWEPPYHSEYENTTGPVRFNVKFTFKEVDGGTQFDSVFESDVPDILGYLGDTLWSQLNERQYETDLQALKHMMESEIPITAPD